MANFKRDSLKSPGIGTDSVTRGTFIVQNAELLIDYDEDEGLQNTRATGSILIEGWNNPLFEAVKEHPLRIQGLVASVMFGVEKKLIRFQNIIDYDILDDGIVKEITLSLTFEILDNLEYLEQVVEYKDDHKL